MTRFWPHGEPVQLLVDPAGAPQSFAWRGAWHAVAVVAQRWRVRTEWWLPEGETWQEYVKLATAGGLLCILAHDLQDDSWRMIRLYD